MVQSGIFSNYPMEVQPCTHERLVFERMSGQSHTPTLELVKHERARLPIHRVYRHWQYYLGFTSGAAAPGPLYERVGRYHSLDRRSDNPVPRCIRSGHPEPRDIGLQPHGGLLKETVRLGHRCLHNGVRRPFDQPLPAASRRRGGTTYRKCGHREDAQRPCEHD